jgi:hypothetical protein
MPADNQNSSETTAITNKAVKISASQSPMTVDLPLLPGSLVSFTALFNSRFRHAARIDAVPVIALTVNAVIDGYQLRPNYRRLIASLHLMPGNVCCQKMIGNDHEKRNQCLNRCLTPKAPVFQAADSNPVYVVFIFIF